MKIHRVFHVGDVIRKLRDAKKWSQTTLGNKAGGINKETISRLEITGKARPDKLEKIVGALGYRPGELMTLAEQLRDACERVFAGREVAPSQASPFRDGERRHGERRVAIHPYQSERRTRPDRRVAKVAQ